MAETFNHYSVMLQETVDSLQVREGGSYIDGTLGGAGHSSEILRRMDGKGHLYGVDQDADAIAVATERLQEFEAAVTIIRDNYCNAVRRLAELGVS